MSNAYNEAHYGNKKFASEVKKTYDKINHNLSKEATLGNKKSALELLEKMSEQNIVLYFLGFRITDGGRLAKIND